MTEDLFPYKNSVFTKLSVLLPDVDKEMLFGKVMLADKHRLDLLYALIKAGEHEILRAEMKD